MYNQPLTRLERTSRSCGWFSYYQLPPPPPPPPPPAEPPPDEALVELVTLLVKLEISLAKAVAAKVLAFPSYHDGVVISISANAAAHFFST